jgi:transposase-like protein
MKPISYARHRFPPDVIRHAVWLYLRFTLSYRDVEDLLAERGLIVSNEAICRWVFKFGPVIAKNLRTSRPEAYTRWHLDEMVVSLSGKKMYMWRAVDGEGEVLEILVQPHRDKAAALRLLRKLLRRLGFVPARLTLNMLLSFAQFEREIAGERIRDKIAASKKKGMWMGGKWRLGQRAQDRKIRNEPLPNRLLVAAGAFLLAGPAAFFQGGPGETRRPFAAHNPAFGVATSSVLPPDPC